MNKKLFIFYIIFWVTGRIYILADDYYNVKIFHSIGLHFNIICLVSYLICITAWLDKFFWQMFLVYEIIAAVVFTAAQLSMDNEVNSFLWAMGSKTSAFNRLCNGLGLIQDVFIPIFIVVVIYVVYAKASAKEIR